MKKESFYYLILVNVVILLLIEILKFFSYNEVMLYLMFGAQYGPLVSSGQWYRIITAMFVHGGFIHLIFNMYALYFLGRIVENVYGTDKFLSLYFLTGIVGNVATHLFYYKSFSVGASGAIFGLVGVLFAAGFRRDTPYTLKSLTGSALLPMILVNIFLGFMPGSNINNAAHLGGFFTGMVLGYFVPIYDYSWNVRKIWKILKWILILLVIISYFLLFINEV
ncbi:Rhomboid family protein [Thermosipho affectus]|uniref:Rhomboid family protein n=1 Tax=Thermosipho affectus TaxID=660294 RepID=A0ABX3II70_9BACT|nr:rhomboid family intramembrane serine protease [Thermosipho affectus]ONN26872.1 Rhomboid family protein [Thermosipho affectus]